ncbi:MAG: hypothetical protein ABSD52_11105 [Candidatus Cybelea sp.]
MRHASAAEAKAKERSFANDEGLGFVAEDFDKPLPPDESKLLYQGGSCRTRGTTSSA